MIFFLVLRIIITLRNSDLNWKIIDALEAGIDQCRQGQVNIWFTYDAIWITAKWPTCWAKSDPIALCLYVGHFHIMLIYPRIATWATVLNCTSTWVEHLMMKMGPNCQPWWRHFQSPWQPLQHWNQNGIMKYSVIFSDFCPLWSNEDSWKLVKFLLSSMGQFCWRWVLTLPGVGSHSQTLSITMLQLSSQAFLESAMHLRPVSMYHTWRSHSHVFRPLVTPWLPGHTSHVPLDEKSTYYSIS